MGLLAIMIATPIIVTLILKGIQCWTAPIAGPITAITVVFYSYLLAPKFRAICAVTVFLVGALFAYAIPDMSWYPECHELAYQRTSIPLLVTYIAGSVALVFCLYFSYKQHNKSLN